MRHLDRCCYCGSGCSCSGGRLSFALRHGERQRMGRWRDKEDYREEEFIHKTCHLILKIESHLLCMKEALERMLPFFP
jgi:hypothetical protein